jgi:putative FmdB family regulatory protein
MTASLTIPESVVIFFKIAFCSKCIEGESAMPTYEYKCKQCEEVFEILQKMTDAPLRDCPVCGGALSKVISGGIGIIFKGSGFYTTDYKNSSAVVSSPAGKNNKESGKEQGTEKEKGIKDTPEKKPADPSSVSSK